MGINCQEVAGEEKKKVGMKLMVREQLELEQQIMTLLNAHCYRSYVRVRTDGGV